MLRIAEALGAGPSSLWPLVKQCGITAAVAGFPHDRQEKPWDYVPLLRMQRAYQEQDFTVDVIEARPPLELTKRGLPGRDEEIQEVLILLESMGKLGIPVWCYEWMAGLNWVRTSVAKPARGGAMVTAFDHEALKDAPPPPLGPISEEELWENLAYFLDKIVPAAEKWDVKLAMHPDDPPVSPLRGVGRIMSSVENYQRLLDMHPSDYSGIALCQGNFALMTEDVPGAIRKFGEQGKIFFVHFRDVKGNKEKFEEAFHDNGKTDMLACMQAYKDVGFDGVARPDHVPTLSGDTNDRPGYSSIGRLFAIGYMKGLHEAVYGKQAEKSSN